MVIHTVQFEEPDADIKPRRLITREPGVLTGSVIKVGLARNPTQAKWIMTFAVILGFCTCTYLLEAVLSGPDIPPRPPLRATINQSDI